MRGKDSMIRSTVGEGNYALSVLLRVALEKIVTQLIAEECLRMKPKHVPKPCRIQTRLIFYHAFALGPRY